jgi:predicted dinucleotide-binding enzyme
MERFEGWSRRAAIGATIAAVVRLMPGARAAEKPLKIATIGAGQIGSTLGTVWVKAGHEVMFSSRHPEELQGLAAGLGPKAHAGSVADAIAFADVVLLAVPYGALPEIAKDHAHDLAPKMLVLDACNPFPNRDGEVATQALAKGAGLYTAGLFPGARIVRAFNAIGAAHFGQGGMTNGVRMGIPIAGDDKKALAVASDLIRETGYEPVVVGNLDFGKYLRPGTPLAGEHTPEEIRSIAATLK